MTDDKSKAPVLIRTYHKSRSLDEAIIVFKNYISDIINRNYSNDQVKHVYRVVNNILLTWYPDNEEYLNEIIGNWVDSNEKYRSHINNILNNYNKNYNKTN